jgi:hypothetical protein
MIAWVLIGLCLLIVLWLVRLVKSAGFWDRVQVDVVEKPRIIGQNLEIFYKHHVGPYSRAAEHVKEIRSLLPDSEKTKILSVYYDNPKEVRDELCQSISGVIYSIDDDVLIESHFATNLTRWGFERVRVPAVERSVVCEQKFSGFFSYLHLIWHVYPKINSFFKEQRFECRLTVELLTDKHLTVFCPLDHTEEFMVPEVIPTDKLEERLTTAAFQTTSDENSELSDEEASDFEDDGDETEGDNAV